MRQAMHAIAIAVAIAAISVAGFVSLWLRPSDSEDYGLGLMLVMSAYCAMALVTVFLVLGVVQGVYAMRGDRTLRTPVHSFILATAAIVATAISALLVWPFVGG